MLSDFQLGLLVIFEKVFFISASLNFVGMFVFLGIYKKKRNILYINYSQVLFLVFVISIILYFLFRSILQKI